jgi:hypothetical protein
MNWEVFGMVVYHSKHSNHAASEFWSADAKRSGGRKSTSDIEFKKQGEGGRA